MALGGLRFLELLHKVLLGRGIGERRQCPSNELSKPMHHPKAKPHKNLKTAALRAEELHTVECHILFQAAKLSGALKMQARTVVGTESLLQIPC